MVNRRTVLGRLVTGVTGVTGVAAMVVVPRALRALAPQPLTVYKSATCGCCAEWVTHMTQSGFAVTVKNVDDVDLIADQMRVPKSLRACHTAVTGRYVISGHVPADLVRQVVREAASRTVGLAVPGMPAGSPGMESPTPERYQIIEWRRDGSTRVYASR